jgi:hypothetical protein
MPTRVIKFASVVFVKYTAQGCVFPAAIFDFQFQIAAITETSASHVWQKHKKTRWVQGFSSSCPLLDLGSGRFLSGSGKFFREDALPGSGEGGLPVVP